MFLSSINDIARWICFLLLVTIYVLLPCNMNGVGDIRIIHGVMDICCCIVLVGSVVFACGHLIHNCV